MNKGQNQEQSLLSPQFFETSLSSFMGQKYFSIFIYFGLKLDLTLYIDLTESNRESMDKIRSVL